MIIKINNFTPISHRERMRIIMKYIAIYEYEDNDIHETRKSPVAITTNRNYHVHCKKKTKTYVFDVWLAP